MHKLDQLKTEVFKRQRVLAGVYERFGQQSVFDYANAWGVSQPGILSDGFAGQVERLLKKIYPAELATAAAGQLKRRPLVSTIDHHGLLNHPFFVNSNLIFSQRRGLKFLVCQCLHVIDRTDGWYFSAVWA